MFPGTSRLVHTSLLHKCFVMARGRAQVAALLEDLLARLVARRTSPKVATVFLSTRMVAGWGLPAQFFTSGGFGGAFSATGYFENSFATTALDIYSFRAWIAATSVAD